MQQRRTVIPLPDYERIYRLICGVLDTRAKTTQSCIFFSLVGAEILRKHYKLDATAMAGSAAYFINAKEAAVHFFGIPDGANITSTVDAFHCWVECEGVVIDFMAPLFGEVLSNAGHSIPVASKMFQKPKVEMSKDWKSLQTEGSFYLNSNVDLANSLFTGFDAKPAVGDLVNVVLYWYRRPPKKLPLNMGMQDDLGNTHTITLKGQMLTGVW